MEEFKQYIKDSRDQFVLAINKTEWNTELRTECENMLIAYDQMAEKIDKLSIARRSFEDVIWMAIRYAHGRHTYAPSMVRDAVNSYKAAFLDFKLIKDIDIKPPESLSAPYEHLSDYLNDLFDEV